MGAERSAGACSRRIGGPGKRDRAAASPAGRISRLRAGSRRLRSGRSLGGAAPKLFFSAQPILVSGSIQVAALLVKLVSAGADALFQRGAILRSCRADFFRLWARLAARFDGGHIGDGLLGNAWHENSLGASAEPVTWRATLRKSHDKAFGCGKIMKIDEVRSTIDEVTI